MKVFARIALPSLVLGLLAWTGLASCAAAPSPAAQAGAQGRRGTVGGLLGARSFDEDDWSPVEEQLVLGVEADWLVGFGGLGVELGFAYSEDDDTVSVPLIGGFTTEATFLELYGGIRQTFGDAPVRPCARTSAPA